MLSIPSGATRIATGVFAVIWMHFGKGARAGEPLFLEPGLAPQATIHPAEASEIIGPVSVSRGILRLVSPGGSVIFLDEMKNRVFPIQLKD